MKAKLLIFYFKYEIEFKMIKEIKNKVSGSTSENSSPISQNLKMNIVKLNIY